jgi:hypothetical protein
MAWGLAAYWSCRPAAFAKGVDLEKSKRLPDGLLFATFYGLQVGDAGGPQSAAGCLPWNRPTATRSGLCA